MAVLIWQVIALGCAEVVLLWAGLGQEDIYKLDPKLGIRHFPNKHVTWRTEGYSRSYFDADGMREPRLTIHKPAGVYRIALLGDSLTEGLQVPIERTFGKLVEKKLSAQLHRPIEVLNFANSTFSTGQEYLLLKEKVFKYSPDLVILGYSNRDMFENWTSPDTTLANVRPFTLAIGGKPVSVDYRSVSNWMETPWAKFLMQTEFLRHHSRIWGLIFSIRSKDSLVYQIYQANLDFQADRNKAMAKWKDEGQRFLLQQISSWASRTTASFSTLSNWNAPKKNVEASQEIKEVHQSIVAQKSSLAPQAVRNHAPSAVRTPPERKENFQYVQLMSSTTRSLLQEMRKECDKHACKFAVVTLPAFAQLCPSPGMETSFNHITYTDEIGMVSASCQLERIPMIDVEAAAERLPSPAARRKLFYWWHFSPGGHEFVAEQLQPFLRELVAK